MACNCIPNGRFEVSNISKAGEDPINTFRRSFDGQMEKLNRELCVWAKPTYGAEGVSALNVLWKAAMIAVAGINTAAQLEIANKQYSIAKDYANLASDRWSRFVNGYAPFEQSMLNEVRNSPEYKPDYNGAKARAEQMNNHAFISSDRAMASIGGAYALCVDSSLIDDMDYAEAVSVDDSANYGYRDEENYAQAKSDNRWNRRSRLLNIGRDNLQQSASYADSANSALDRLKGLAGAGAQGAMNLIGYLSTIRETQYPSFFTGGTALSGSSSQALGADLLQFGPS